MEKETTQYLESVHAIMLELLTEMDQICRKNQIPYTLDSGTLLGAVRHKGFIPWDDDVDILIQRKDFPRFCKVMEKELGEDFEFLYPDCQKGAFFDFIPRISYINSRTMPECEETRYYGNKQHRIQLDCFIMDSAGNNGLGHRLQVLALKTIYGLAMGHRYRVDYSKYGGIQKAAVWLLATLGKLCSLERLFKVYRRVSLWQNQKAGDYRFVSNAILPDIDKVFYQEDFAAVVETPFEGKSFYIPAGYHRILTGQYGDYMTPPPEKERQPSHVSFEQITSQKEG